MPFTTAFSEPTSPASFLVGLGGPAGAVISVTVLAVLLPTSLLFPRPIVALTGSAGGELYAPACPVNRTMWLLTATAPVASGPAPMRIFPPI